VDTILEVFLLGIGEDISDTIDDSSDKMREDDYREYDDKNLKRPKISERPLFDQLIYLELEKYWR
jgi:hypothetical protein